MVNIIKGQDKTVRFSFMEDGSAWDLTGYTSITVYFPAATTITKTYGGGDITVLSASGGSIELTLSDTETATMNTGYGQIIELIVDKSTVRKMFQIRDIMNVTVASLP